MEVIEPTQVGFLVTGDWCDRCGDQNYDGETRVCLTCTYPEREADGYLYGATLDEVVAHVSLRRHADEVCTSLTRSGGRGELPMIG